MKNTLLPVVLLAAIVAGGCKKDKEDTAVTLPPPMSYEERMEGEWELQAVSYFSEIPVPDPQSPQILVVEGEGENVLGDFVLNRNPHTFTYNYSFTASMAATDSTPPISIPVQQSGEGTWTTTSDESMIILTEDGEQTVLTVVEDENHRQVYESMVEQNVMGIITVDVEVDLELVRK